MLISLLFAALTTLSLSGETKKNVYIYFKSNENKKYYYLLGKDTFYNEIFGTKYAVILTNTLKDLKDAAYIVTEEVPLYDLQYAFLAHYPKNKVLLFSFEAPLTQTRSQQKEYHQYYSKIFTWCDDLIDSIKYFKVRYPWTDPLPMITNRLEFEAKKLCVFVAGYNYIEAPCSNHPERMHMIEFFEKNYPNYFDLYGPSWQVFHYSCYKGIIPLGQTNKISRMNKINVIKNYKFDMCYENAQGLNGYVTERIFDAFAAGCIPIYCGAKNIEDYISKNCFIALADFKSYEDLYSFMTHMTREEYDRYIRNIQEYLTSQIPEQLTTRSYIENIRRVLNITD